MGQLRDISLPLSEVPDFVRTRDPQKAVTEIFEEARKEQIELRERFKIKKMKKKN